MYRLNGVQPMTLLCHKAEHCQVLPADLRVRLPPRPPRAGGEPYVGAMGQRLGAEF